MDAHSAQAAEKIRQRANKVHPGTAADKPTTVHDYYSKSTTSTTQWVSLGHCGYLGILGLIMIHMRKCSVGLFTAHKGNFGKV